MKCINERKHNPSFLKRVFCLLLSLLFFCTGCGSAQYAMPYTVSPEVSSYRIVSTEQSMEVAKPFAEELCVAAEDVNVSAVEMSKASSAGLFDINASQTVYAKNIHEKLYPASLTKIMTALVAIKYGSTDMTLTATANVKITESGAQVCGIKEGDKLTLNQALHLLLINSANDAAVVIAEGVAGSVEAFAEMMNQEALLLGATNTHFVNPHGLTDDNHYSTAYDLYLIMNEAVKYSLFNEIIQMDSYSTVYYDKSGKEKEVSVKNTNYYIQGTAEAPGGVTVLGGKTGTTNAAGHCLILLSRDSSSKPYISIILRAEDKDSLYGQMTELLGEINN